MTSAGLQDFLTKAGISADSYVRPEYLNSILLESDATHFYNSRAQIIKFSPSDEMITIKYSMLYPRSAILNRFSYNQSENTIYVQTPFGSAYYIKSIREPKVGDTIAVYDSVEKAYASSLISSLARSASGALAIKLADTNVIGKIVSAARTMCFYCVLQDEDYDTGNSVVLDSEPFAVYWAKSYSENENDIYIGLDRVSGIELSKRWKAA